MKKLAIFVLVTSLVSGYTITYEEWRDSNRKELGIKCNDGSHSFVYYTPKVLNTPYMSSQGTYYRTQNEAANKSCSSHRSSNHSSKIYKIIKKDSLACQDIEDLKYALKSKGNYSFALIAIGSDNDCIRIAVDSKVIYHKIFYMKQSGYIDNYSKVEASDGIYYVRESSLK